MNYSLNPFHYLCAALLLAGTGQLIAEETSNQLETATTPEQKESNPPRYLPAGSDANRKASLEYMNVLKHRSDVEESVVVSEEVDSDSIAKEELQENDSEQAPESKTKSIKEAIGTVSASGMNPQFSYNAAYQMGYFSSHPGAIHHLIQPGLLVGGTLQLEDFSTWSISSSDSYKVMNWMPSDQIIIRTNYWWSSYSFIIENVDAGVKVAANLLQYLHPVYHTIFNHQIVAFDDYQRMIWLEDGTIWSVDSWDYSTSWKIGQTVIIGINTSYGSSTNPNILINANLSPQYVRARCIN